MLPQGVISSVSKDGQTARAAHVSKACSGKLCRISTKLYVASGWGAIGYYIQSLWRAKKEFTRHLDDYRSCSKTQRLDRTVIVWPNCLIKPELKFLYLLSIDVRFGKPITIARN